MQQTQSVTLEWINDHRIAFFTLPDVSRSTLDLWTDMIIQLIKDWPADKTYCALHDVSRPGAGLTPYMRQKIMEIDRQSDHLRGRVAFISPKTFVSQIAKLYIQQTSRNRPLSSAIFFSQAEAIAWLERA
jgi:hypothetical protein